MTGKIHEMLTDEELDKVVGGSSYTMLEYKKNPDGHYSYKVTHLDGDAASWKSFCEGKPVNKLNVTISSSSGGMAESKWGTYIERQQKRYGEGLVIKEMK